MKAPQRIAILGGNSGLGLAIAKNLHSEGHRIVIAARDEGRLKAAANEIPGCETRTFDIVEESSVRALFEGLGSIDHLVVTAAEVPGGRILETPAKDVRSAMNTRFWGAYLATHFGAQYLTPNGSITLFSGLSATKPFVGESLGAASCGAIEGFIRTLAVEIAPIRVNAIAPGVIDTPLLDTYFGAEKENVLNQLATTLPVGRSGRPEDVASAVRFLIMHTFITGNLLQVDGGHRLI